MKKALFSISIITLVILQSCSNNDRETINTFNGVSIGTKEGSGTLTLKNVGKIEIGKDFIYLFEKDKTSPTKIIAKSEIMLINILQAPKQ